MHPRDGRGWGEVEMGTREGPTVLNSYPATMSQFAVPEILNVTKKQQQDVANYWVLDRNILLV